jgi:hypothetical protein
MYEEHPVFSPPDDPDCKLWRYMDLAKFLSLLEDEALFFSSAASMSDRFEGSRGLLDPARGASLGEGYAVYEQRFMTPLSRLQRGYTHLSCWHESPYESAAMWDLYQRDGYGVAVQSTFRRLTESFQSDRLIYAGRVNYIDFGREIIPDGNMYTPYLYKWRSFEHEREVRAVLGDNERAINAWWKANSPSFGLTMSFAAGQDIEGDLRKLETAFRNLDPEIAPLPGILVPVDLEKLVEAVYVAPGVADWYTALVQKLLIRYHHEWPVRHSDLDRDPVS